MKYIANDNDDDKCDNDENDDDQPRVGAPRPPAQKLIVWRR